jgi:hypothetical protein
VDQALAGDDAPGEPDVQFAVAVEVRKRLASIAKGRKAVATALQWLIFDAQSGQTPDELAAHGIRSGAHRCLGRHSYWASAIAAALAAREP